ncbi:hypothetical protein MRY87_12430 [bacterium]|nr:hypothetical protein [bacterium]
MDPVNCSRDRQDRRTDWDADSQSDHLAILVKRVETLSADQAEFQRTAPVDVIAFAHQAKDSPRLGDEARGALLQMVLDHPRITAEQTVGVHLELANDYRRRACLERAKQYTDKAERALKTIPDKQPKLAAQIASTRFLTGTKSAYGAKAGGDPTATEQLLRKCLPHGERAVELASEGEAPLTDQIRYLQGFVSVLGEVGEFERYEEFDRRYQECIDQMPKGRERAHAQSQADCTRARCQVERFRQTDEMRFLQEAADLYQTSISGAVTGLAAIQPMAELVLLLADYPNLELSDTDLLEPPLDKYIRRLREFREEEHPENVERMQPFLDQALETSSRDS